MRVSRRGLCLLLAGLVPTSAGAHRAHVGLTRISLNARAARWEIEHRLHYHDAELALRRLAKAARLQLTSVEGRARLALHVEECFKITSPNGAVLPLSTVGADFANDNLLIFQETPVPQAPGVYTLENRMLMALVPGQTNRVSLAFKVPPETLTLTSAQPRGTFTNL
jgi:hypothetical protein